MGCDVCLVQETFLCQKDDAKIKEMMDHNWIMKSDPRKHRSGGGIGVLHHSNIKMKSNEKIMKYKSFQVMEVVITAKDELLRLVNIYRPGYSQKARHTQCARFLKSFQTI